MGDYIEPEIGVGLGYGAWQMSTVNGTSLSQGPLLLSLVQPLVPLILPSPSSSPWLILPA